MNKNITTILPNIGLGDIKFGLNRNQVKEILGEADEIDVPFKISWTRELSTEINSLFEKYSPPGVQ